MRTIPRVMIAAPQSGSGKTLITCALLQALLDRGETAAAFKCGPDYIDPMFHRSVLGVPSKNLDTFFSDEKTTRSLLSTGMEGCSFAVLEGVMGLYDGLAGTKEEASSYHLAQVTQTPIILVVNARGMGRSLLPLISGFLQYDHEHLIQGVILNRTSNMFCKLIKPEIERELQVKVLGYVPAQENIHLESRHLGLRLPEEILDLREQIKSMANVLSESVDIETILQIGEEHQILEGDMDIPFLGGQRPSVRIGIARDEAFCFYYEDNLRLLEQAGAELIPFSPIHDKTLPPNLQGILLGGGYPELYAKELSENVSMKEQIRRVIDSGMPSLAECGGFMYLHEKMQDMNGIFYDMVGAVKGSCSYQKKLLRFGYCTISAVKGHSFLPADRTIKAHEFHYFDSTDNGTDCQAKKPVTGRSWECIHAGENHFWGFPHLYYYSNPDFVRNFVDKASKYKKKR